MVISEQQPPPTSGGIYKWERGLDPWHKDAFPVEFKNVGTDGERKKGWHGLDWCGNVITFVADGTEIAEA